MSEGVSASTLSLQTDRLQVSRRRAVRSSRTETPRAISSIRRQAARSDGDVGDGLREAYGRKAGSRPESPGTRTRPGSALVILRRLTHAVSRGSEPPFEIGRPRHRDSRQLRL